MELKTLRRILFCLLLSGAPILGHSQDNGRTPVISAPGFEVSAGYAYMIQRQPFATRVELIGADGNAIMQFTRHWGGTADVTYTHVGNVLQTPHGENILSGLVGPVFYPIQHEKTTVFLHALGGMAWVSSAVPVSPTAYYSGYETRFSYAVGGAAERVIQGPFAVRAGADYQRTSFVNPNLGLQKQNDFRLILSLVYRFGRR
jgi:hypothetical protein